MDLQMLLTGLSDPAAYPHPVAEVSVRQTHISAVFLTDDLVYKIKKPVKFSFLDFSSLENRYQICQREVQLNRRLAANVYLDVVPIVVQDGRLQVEGRGEQIEWAVKMRRLPEAATLEQRLNRNEVSGAQVATLANRLAEFHRTAAFMPEMVQYARFEAVARNIADNLEVARQFKPGALDSSLILRLSDLTAQHLAGVRNLIDQRADQGVPRDVHGDLHLDHIYLFPDIAPPGDLAIIDCIEFNDAFRFIDPVADLAFLVMDMKFHHRRDLASQLISAYFGATRDAEGMRLLSLYSSYRAAVRAKVETLAQDEVEIEPAERTQAEMRARAHWMLALCELERPSNRPGIVLVGGLPGTGKSTLARCLAAQGDFRVIRSDEVRKELAGQSSDTSAAARFQEGIYSREWTEKTYNECLRRAESDLLMGRRVIVDATFLREADRRRFKESAQRLALSAVCLLCVADQEVVHRRLNDRRGDVSDADWGVYLEATKQWEPPGPSESLTTSVIDSGQSTEHSMHLAVEVLTRAELL